MSKTIPVDIMVIYGEGNYRCEVRKGAKLFRAVNGDFLVQDKEKANKIKKLSEIVADGLIHLAVCGKQDISDYNIHISIQPVPDVFGEGMI